MVDDEFIFRFSILLFAIKRYPILKIMIWNDSRNVFWWFLYAQNLKSAKLFSQSYCRCSDFFRSAPNFPEKVMRNLFTIITFHRDNLMISFSFNLFKTSGFIESVCKYLHLQNCIKLSSYKIVTTEYKDRNHG